MPKVIDHNKMKQLILEKSHIVFGNLGYQLVSMRTLADEIGVSTGVLYHYFESKESLVQAVLSMGFDKTVLGTTGNPSFHQIPVDLPILQKIESLFAQMNEKDQTAITNIMLLSDYFRDLKTDDSVKKNYKVAYQFLESFRKSMGLEEDQIDLARFLLTYLVGMHTIRMWTAKKMTIKEFGRILTRYFKNES